MRSAKSHAGIEGSDELPRVMVVDDDSLTRETLAKILTRAGYFVVKACNGREALQEFDEAPPQMVLMDVVMPEMDGFQACAEMRSRADAHALPILMMTGLEDKESVQHAFEAGATDFITKPINWALLDQRVRYSLRTRALALELSSNQARLSHAQRVARMGYWYYDLKKEEMLCSDELFHLVGNAIDHSHQNCAAFLSLVANEDRHRVETAMHGALKEQIPFAFDHTMQHANGEVLVVHHQASLELDDKGFPLRVVGILQDVTARKRAEEKVLHQAYHDELTDLPNRRKLMDIVNAMIARSRKDNELVAALFFSLDRSRIINETLGHDITDALLKSVATRLSRYQQDGYGVARFSTDIFTLVMGGLPNVEVAEYLARNLRDTLAEPYVIDGNELFSTISIGIAYYPMGINDGAELLRAADLALHQAIERGGNQTQIYNVELSQLSTRRLKLANELQKALAGDQFAIYYQPQVDAKTGKLVGLEALLRWKHPDLGVISPLEFIPIAEETGLVVSIGDWVLQQAVGQLAQWQRRGMNTLRMGVNLSARQFSQSNLLGKIEGVLGKNRVSPECLELEITESLAMQDMDHTVVMLQELRDLGIRTSLDDFGTGFSSMSYLNRLPLDTLKIDRAFVKDIHGGGEGGAIADAILAMASSLNMHTIAEGVETRDQLVHMIQHGAQEIQGYYFSTPRSVQALEDMFGAADYCADSMFSIPKL